MGKHGCDSGDRRCIYKNENGNCTVFSDLLEQGNPIVKCSEESHKKMLSRVDSYKERLLKSSSPEDIEALEEINDVLENVENVEFRRGELE